MSTEEDLELQFPGWTIRADDMEAHMWPEHDRVEHETSRHCVCSPHLEMTIDGVEVWIHYDESTESAVKLAPRR